MPFEGDERAATVVIGAVLMFGILISGLAMYQADVVPSENSQVEWDHQQDVTTDLIDLRNAIVNAGYQNATREASVSLGMQYDDRSWAINPPDPQGTIRTNSTGDPQVKVTFEDGTTTSLNTSFIEYEPGYHEYDAPKTIIEHGLVYERHAEADVVRDAGGVVSNERVIIPLIEGDLSESSRSSASITVETIDVYRASNDVDSVHLPTNSFEAWDEAYTVSETNGRAAIDVSGDQEVYIAQIVVGDGDRDGETSGELSSFGDPVTARGGQSQSNEFDLDWDDDSVTGSPEETVTLTATIDAQVENARADFSFRDPKSVVDTYDPENQTTFDENGEATFDVTLANDASDGDEVQVYVSSGGTTKQATLTVENDGAPSITHLDASSQNHQNQARFDGEWEATAGDVSITYARIELIDSVSGSVVDSETYDAPDGQNPRDYTVDLKDTSGAGQEYTIRLTVEDADGNVDVDEIVRTG